LTKGEIQSEFERLDNRRTNKLQRAQDCSRLTVPGLYPEDGFTETMELPDIYSSLPARGVMALASRMVSAIYPLNQTPFFNLEIDQQYVPQGVDTTETMSQLARLDKKIMDKLSSTNLRQELFVLFQHLIVIGDALFQCTDDYQFRVHRIDHYVVQRYPDGRVYRIILREWVDPDAIPENWNYDSKAEMYGSPENGPSSDHKPYFTEIVWNPSTSKWDVSVEYCGQVVDGGTYDVNPYIPQVWSRIAGEDYGRSLCEEHIGDIRTLEALTKSLVEAAAANAEFRIGVDPTGITEVSDLQETENGDFVPARAVDVFAVQLAKQIDLGPMAGVRQDLIQNLSRTFLLQSSVQRNADRVTATEIREVAQELDQTLGGIFSGMARDIQIPLVRRAMILMSRDKLIPKELVSLITSDKGMLNLKVRTGLEALNREVQNSQLAQWAQIVGSIKDLQPYIDWYGWGVKWTSSFGLEPVGLIKTPQQLEAEQQKAAQSSIEQMAAQQSIQSLGGMAEAAAKQGMAPQ